ncbi:hypothetical protein FQN60_005529 [Etheostoma spectabile]|uniref:Uncharacterized protein n=1 Tax=Etheostoma spectabile TaxID=54343 RepID=A0A5J5CDH4_9PERO|nr:hypothetical protein FQN60_005529 [Etheostoma spectabile]
MVRLSDLRCGGQLALSDFVGVKTITAAMARTFKKSTEDHLGLRRKLLGGVGAPVIVEHLSGSQLQRQGQSSLGCLEQRWPEELTLDQRLTSNLNKPRAENGDWTSDLRPGVNLLHQPSARHWWSGGIVNFLSFLWTQNQRGEIILQSGWCFFPPRAGNVEVVAGGRLQETPGSTTPYKKWKPFTL